jgi:hypothetical protein
MNEKFYLVLWQKRSSEPPIKIELVRAHLKGLSTKNVLGFEPMDICTCGLLLNPTTVPNFQYMGKIMLFVFVFDSYTLIWARLFSISKTMRIILVCVKGFNYILIFFFQSFFIKATFVALFVVKNVSRTSGSQKLTKNRQKYPKLFFFSLIGIFFEFFKLIHLFHCCFISAFEIFRVKFLSLF